MNTSDKEKIEMNTAPTTNQRLVTILLVLLIVLVSLLVIGIVLDFLMTGGMTLAPGASAGVGGWMMGINGQAMNNMMAACTDFMRNIQKP